MGGLRIACSAGVLALAIGGACDVATAASDICTRLEARLMAIDSRPNDGGLDNFRNFDDAVQKQREDLDQATEDARRAGCLGGFFRRLKSGSNCGAIMASIDRMRANLNRLTTQRGRYSDDPFAGGRERAELIRALAANQCGEHYEAEAFDRPARRGGLFATLFGGHLFRERGWGGNFFDNDFGTYRTLCVRTCDGYYFPISFSTVRSRFAADEQTCRSMCPGTDVTLYIHHNPGQESDAMVSLAGEPYLALPTAFRYRREYDKSCSCGRIAASPSVMTEIAGTTVPAGNDPWGFARSAEAPALPDRIAPVPATRPASGEDPETLANRAGGFVPAPVVPAPAAVAGLSPDGQRSVRVVGPSYFYAQ
jgi:hypothetical protein